MKIPPLPLLSKTSPQNTCFLIIACTVLTPLLFSLTQKGLISSSLKFSSPLPLISCRGDSLIFGFKYSPPSNISGGESVWCRWLNRKILTHFTFHCIFSVLEKPHKWLVPFFFPPSPTELQMLLIHHWHSLCSAVCLFTPSKCWDTPEPHCSLLLSSMYLHLLPVSALGKASDIVPVTSNPII